MVLIQVDIDLAFLMDMTTAKDNPSQPIKTPPFQVVLPAFRKIEFAITDLSRELIPTTPAPSANRLLVFLTMRLSLMANKCLLLPPRAFLPAKLVIPKSVSVRTAFSLAMISIPRARSPYQPVACLMTKQLQMDNPSSDFKLPLFHSDKVALANSVPAIWEHCPENLNTPVAMLALQLSAC